jgi:2-keto-3-deoxy-L-rhamnonate aldolase RhmA
MLVIEQIETPVGVSNAYNIATVAGVDVILGSTGDMQNFSGLEPSNPEYQAYFTRIHDATLKAGSGRSGAAGDGRGPGRH